MPSFRLPSGHRGWLVALAAALVGMIAGGVALNVFARWAS